jgi:hypothetical protein
VPSADIKMDNTMFTDIYVGDGPGEFCLFVTWFSTVRRFLSRDRVVASCHPRNHQTLRPADCMTVPGAQMQRGRGVAAAQRGHAPLGRRSPALDLRARFGSVPPRPDGRSAWHDRPAASAEIDAGRYRNGHDCGVPAGVAFPCTSLLGRRTVVALRTLCTEATVSVAPSSLFRVRRS